MAQEGNAFHANHICGCLLLALAKPRHLRPRPGDITRPFVSGGGDDEVDDHSASRHLQDGAAAIELDVAGVRDDAECAFDAPVVRSAEELAPRHPLLRRASSTSSRAPPRPFPFTPPLII